MVWYGCTELFSVSFGFPNLVDRTAEMRGMVWFFEWLRSTASLLLLLLSIAGTC